MIRKRATAREARLPSDGRLLENRSLSKSRARQHEQRRLFPRHLRRQLRDHSILRYPPCRNRDIDNSRAELSFFDSRSAASASIVDAVTDSWPRPARCRPRQRRQQCEPPATRPHRLRRLKLGRQRRRSSITAWSTSKRGQLAPETRPERKVQGVNSDQSPPSVTLRPTRSTPLHR